MHTVSSPDTRFAEIAERAAAAQVRPEFEISSAPAPSRLAPHACTLTVASVAPDEQAGWESASGRFVLLHDPDGVDEWQGTFRAVIFARCDVEAEMLADPLVHEVAWSWTLDALESLHATNVGGTVTVSTGNSFGVMSDRRADGLIEVRASWTPGLSPIPTLTPSDSQSVDTDDVQDHVRAWIDVLSQLAGLPPQPLGVPTVSARRARQS